MFGFKRRRDAAERLGRAMIIMRDACRTDDLNDLMNVIAEHGYVRIDVDFSRGGPLAAWSREPLDTTDVIYYLNSSDYGGGPRFEIVAQGYRKLGGLMIFAGATGDIHVEVSKIAQKSGQMGSDTLVVSKILRTFPGFGSIDQLRARLVGQQAGR